MALREGAALSLLPPCVPLVIVTSASTVMSVAHTHHFGNTLSSLSQGFKRHRQAQDVVHHVIFFILISYPKRFISLYADIFYNYLALRVEFIGYD